MAHKLDIKGNIRKKKTFKKPSKFIINMIDEYNKMLKEYVELNTKYESILPYDKKLKQDKEKAEQNLFSYQDKISKKGFMVILNYNTLNNLEGMLINKNTDELVLKNSYEI